MRSSYGGDSHHDLAVGSRGDASVAGSDLTQDVEDGVAAVVVEDSPEPPHTLAPPAAAAAQAVGVSA